MERIKKGAELAASRHGYQAGELTVASLCPYSRDQFSRRHRTKAIKRRVTNSARPHSHSSGEAMTTAKRGRPVQGEHGLIATPPK